MEIWASSPSRDMLRRGFATLKAWTVTAKTDVVPGWGMLWAQRWHMVTAATGLPAVAA